MTDNDLLARMREADHRHAREHFATILRECGNDARKTKLTNTEPQHGEKDGNENVD